VGKQERSDERIFASSKLKVVVHTSR